MREINYTLWNRILGWSIATISFAVYACTAEPTNSFWDVGEYIATSSKLQIGHPPGAPFFQICGAFISVFSPDKLNIAYTLHLMSAISAALTIALLFWSTVILLKKMILVSERSSTYNRIAISGSACVGSLGFAFTDSFWFNAVEAEVYAMANCMLALLFYLGLLWERDMNSPRGYKWLVLISFFIGISFGIHFMSLLAIPSIVLLYYFKKHKKKSFKKFVVANVLAVFALLFVFKILVPYTLLFFGASEIFFVNTFGLPFHSGTIIAFLILCLVFYLGLNYCFKKGFVLVHTLLLSTLFILIGFSSWIMVPIRANAGTVINENNPDNARELLAYYNLEQYPGNPLLFGPQYTEKYAYLDKDTPYKDGKPKYEKNTKTNTYDIVNTYKNSIQNLDDAHKTIFPRMWNTEKAKNYFQFQGVPGFSIKKEFRNEEKLREIIVKFRTAYASGEKDLEDYDRFLQQFGNYLDIEKPSFLDNISFFVEYQLGYMYWRYFMWNFVGRQNDVQGMGDTFDGNWLSGIDFIDEWHLGSQRLLPSDVLKNKGRNTYFFIPLLIGVLGVFVNYKKDKSLFWVLTVFFLFTGIALKVYLNEKPYEVRERDYALVGSFYIFAFWIGFGVFGIIDLSKKYYRAKILVSLILLISFIAVPVLFISRNWDDHDRSNRYTAQTMAKNYLSSCQDNAILFTIGDNDTFPLWYVQEIEEYRTDIRLICTSLLATDWYIDQMKTTAYQSQPIPSQLTHDFYKFGSNDLVYFDPISDSEDPIPIAKWMNWIQSNDPRTKGELRNGDTVNTFPTRKVRIPVDKKAVLENGIVPRKDADKILPFIDIEIKSDYLLKHRLLMLDIIANNHWERPIYFSGGSYNDDDYIWMKEYLQLDGLVYKLVPIKTTLDPATPYDYGRIDADHMYKIVKQWDWGNGESSTIYHDPETRKNSITYRKNLGRLAQTLIEEKEIDKAKEILDLGMHKMPIDYYDYYSALYDFIKGYYRIGEKETARKLWENIVSKHQEQLLFFAALSLTEQYHNAEHIIFSIEHYKALIGMLAFNESHAYIANKKKEFNRYLKKFVQFYY